MAKAAYIGVGGVARKVKQPYIGVSSVARKVKSGYIGVSGVARQFFSGGTPITSLAVGSSVYMNVNGTQTEFIVVHQGLPSSAYDSSCNGAWLLMKNIVGTSSWHTLTYSQCFSSSENVIRQYLDNTFAATLDENVYNQIKTVSIPTMTIRNGSASVLGIASLKVFLLSTDEINQPRNDDGKYPTLVEGSALSYFSGTQDSTYYSKCVADYEGNATSWWLRSESKYLGSGYVRAYAVGTGGSSNSSRVDNKKGVRPAMIFPSTTLVNDQNVIIT